MAVPSKMIERYERRFGSIAIDKGFITLNDLIQALVIQVQEEILKGTHRLIGQILFDLNIMTTTQIEEVLKEIFKHEA